MLNPNARLLAVVGAFQVTVIVLPRHGFTRLAPPTVDCKCVPALELMSCLLMKIGKISAGRPVLPRFWFFATNRQGRLAPMGRRWLYPPCDDLRRQVAVSATNTNTFIPRTELWYREYDISVDADEPQQTISFMPERRASRSFIAQDSTEREVASFTLGKGAADWGPLTVYALTKSGDIYSFCPYLPKNAYVTPNFIAATLH